MIRPPGDVGRLRAGHRQAFRRNTRQFFWRVRGRAASPARRRRSSTAARSTSSRRRTIVRKCLSASRTPRRWTAAGQSSETPARIVRFTSFRLGTADRTFFRRVRTDLPFGKVLSGTTKGKALRSFERSERLRSVSRRRAPTFRGLTSCSPGPCIRGRPPDRFPKPYASWGDP